MTPADLTIMPPVIPSGQNKGSVNGYRWDQEEMFAAIPWMLDIESVLYVGAAVLRNWPLGLFMVPSYRRNNITIDVLERWPANVAKLKVLNEQGRQYNNVRVEPGLFREIIQGDARNAHLDATDAYNGAFWWQGPDHIPVEDLSGALASLELCANKHVIVGTPWGCRPSGPQYGNPHETRLGSYYPEHFEACGYQTQTWGEVDKRGRLLAWKRKDIDA